MTQELRVRVSLIAPILIFMDETMNEIKRNKLVKLIRQKNKLCEQLRLISDLDITNKNTLLNDIKLVKQKIDHIKYG